MGITVKTLLVSLCHDKEVQNTEVQKSTVQSPCKVLCKERELSGGI
jgi:hypothetical protein